jgi:RNA polymerase sigma-70 factor (ECF subfamily)
MEREQPVVEGGVEPTAQSRPGRFEDLTLPHLKSLYRLALQLSGNPAAAEDLVQETYLKALKAFPSLRDPERVRPWLFQILNRLATDRYRRESREVSAGEVAELDRFSLYDRIVEEDPFPYAEHIHEDFISRFQHEEVRKAISALPEVYRLPLLLLYTEDLSYRELADVLDCPVGTVMSRLHRGRKILERELWECAKRRGWVRRGRDEVDELRASNQGAFFLPGPGTRRRVTGSLRGTPQELPELL